MDFPGFPIGPIALQDARSLAIARHATHDFEAGTPGDADLGAMRPGEALVSRRCNYGAQIGQLKIGVFLALFVLFLWSILLNK